MGALPLGVSCACALTMPAGNKVAPTAAAPEVSRVRRDGFTGSLLEFVVMMIGR